MNTLQHAHFTNIWKTTRIQNKMHVQVRYMVHSKAPHLIIFYFFFYLCLLMSFPDICVYWRTITLLILQNLPLSRLYIRHKHIKIIKQTAKYMTSLQHCSGLGERLILCPTYCTQCLSLAPVVRYRPRVSVGWPPSTEIPCCHTLCIHNSNPSAEHTQNICIRNQSSQDVWCQTRIKRRPEAGQ